MKIFSVGAVDFEENENNYVKNNSFSDLTLSAWLKILILLMSFLLILFCKK